MKSPIISLIGRPNVGKSSLFNALKNFPGNALIGDRPGVTRDRHYGLVSLGDGEGDFFLVDTGGFYPDGQGEGAFYDIMAQQARTAIEESDLVLLVLDIRQGLSPFDESIARAIRAQKKEFWVILNKADGPKQRLQEGEFFALGMGQDKLFSVSAAHRLGLEELKNAFRKKFFERQSALPAGLLPTREVCGRLALVGAPNVGKSTLLNQLMGLSRSLVSDVPGTTLDPVEGHFDLRLSGQWRSLQILDTAGIRKKSSISDKLEAESVYRALRCVGDCDLVLYLVDALKGVGHQDRRLLEIALDKGKSVLVCVNKMDLLEEDERHRRLDELVDAIPWPHLCRLIPLCAREGKGLGALKKAIERALDIRQTLVPTSALNRIVGELVRRRPMVLGRKPFKVKYVSQVKSSPPTFLFYANRVREIPENYRRYLKNGLRGQLRLEHTPVHLIFRRSDQVKKTNAPKSSGK